MPQGQYSLADVQSAPPVPVQTGQFSMTDVIAQPTDRHPNLQVQPSNPSTVPNPRIRNVQMPYDPDQSIGRNAYEGAKTGIELGSLPALLYATPAGLALGTVGSAGGSVAGKAVAKGAGGGDFAQEVGGDVGGLTGGVAATTGGNWAALKAKTFYNALPDDVQKAFLGLLSPRVAHALQLADALGIGKEAPALDATAENKPYAGEPTPVPAKPLDATGENKAYAGEPMPQPQKPLDATGENAPYAGEKNADVRRYIQTVIDAKIPPSGDTVGLNKRVAAQVDVSLSQGDVASAEKVLDTAAKAANPAYTPPDRPRIVPSVQNIRENLAQAQSAQAQPNRPTADSLDDRGLQQEMNWDLQRHGFAAESEARREFIARNSTGVTKSELTGAAEKPVKYTKTAGVPSPVSGNAAGMTPGEVDDLMGKMQTMLDAARKAKSGQN
jgi:hypothetical protein